MTSLPLPTEVNSTTAPRSLRLVVDQLIGKTEEHYRIAELDQLVLERVPFWSDVCPDLSPTADPAGALFLLHHTFLNGKRLLLPGDRREHAGLFTYFEPWVREVTSFNPYTTCHELTLISLLDFQVDIEKLKVIYDDWLFAFQRGYCCR